MDALKKAQDACSKKLLSEEKYCDAVAVLREGQRVPFVRPLLASLSPPLDKALYLGRSSDLVNVGCVAIFQAYKIYRVRVINYGSLVIKKGYFMAMCFLAFRWKTIGG